MVLVSQRLRLKGSAQAKGDKDKAAPCTRTKHWSMRGGSFHILIDMENFSRYLGYYLRTVAETLGRE